VVLTAMKFRLASAMVSDPGVATVPKLHGRFSQPEVEAVFDPVVESVANFVKLTAAASRAGLVVTSDHVPAGSVCTAEPVDTEPGFPEPQPYVKGPAVESVTFATVAL
jgi:hypothetical protein